MAIDHPDPPPSNIEVDVAGQKAWAMELLHAACDMLDAVKAGYEVSPKEKQLRLNGLRFAYGRARELGFEAELDVWMLVRGIHVKGE